MYTALVGVVNWYLGEHGLMLRHDATIDANIILAPSSTESEDGRRNPEMQQANRGNQYCSGMKAHIGVDADTAMVTCLGGTSANTPSG